jgi:hypothetical protein
MSNNKIEESNVTTIELLEFEKVQVAELKHITTLNIFKGIAKTDEIKQRCKDILEKNLWLTSTIKTKSYKGEKCQYHINIYILKKISLIFMFIIYIFKYILGSFINDVNIDTIIDDYFFIDNDSGNNNSGIKIKGEYFSENDSYNVLSGKFDDKKYVCGSAIEMDMDKTCKTKAFKVTVIPMNTDRFALIVSVNHTLADGHTYYQIFKMFNPDTEVKSLNYIRHLKFNDYIKDYMDKDIHASSYGMGVLFNYLARLIQKMWRKVTVLTYKLDKNKIQAIKDDFQKNNNLNSDNKNNFISTNDILSSLFCNQCVNPKTGNLGISSMAINARNKDREKDFSANDNDAGNYEFMISYLKPNECNIPHLIRKSILDNNGNHISKRCGDSKVKDVNFFTTRWHVVTNWSSFFNPINYTDCELIKHVPVMPTDLYVPMGEGAVIFNLNNNDIGIQVHTFYNKDGFKKELEEIGTPV